MLLARPGQHFRFGGNNMKDAETQKLISWLKYFDVEYVDNDMCEVLSKLDINDPKQQVEAINLAVVSGFFALNDKSKSSMKEILADCKNRPESELEPVFSRVGMPFVEPVMKRREFLQSIWNVVFNQDACE